MKPVIEIIISPAGEIAIDAVGFKGADCESATQYLEAALGKPVHRNRKPDYYQSKKTGIKQKVGQ